MTSTLTTLCIRIRGVLAARDSRGASLVEYALLVALIAIVCVSAVFFLGGETSEAFDSIGSSITQAT